MKQNKNALLPFLIPDHCSQWSGRAENDCNNLHKVEYLNRIVGPTQQTVNNGQVEPKSGTRFQTLYQTMLWLAPVLS